MPKLSTIIVSYKNLDVVIDCLDSIEVFNDIGKELQVILVDNSLDNNILDYVKANYPWVETVKSRENKGFGAGCNLGAKHSQGEYLLFLNPDTVLVEPIFQFAVDVFQRNTDLGMFGVKLVNPDLSKNQSFHFSDKSGTFWALVYKVCDRLDLFIDGKMYITGADIFIRKDLFFDCGMFDENLFMYSEERDLVKRVSKLGFKTGYFPTKKIIHLEGKSTDSNIEAKVRMQLQSQKYYCDKHGIDFERMTRGQLRYDYVRLLVHTILGNEKATDCKKIISARKEFLENL
ncbi:MAG TPA: glycosyltransferase family 2 protein [Fervidobacterium sp.]|nr:glycosyltransferase family 2 protein [Fervidobacterium sp.]